MHIESEGREKLRWWRSKAVLQPNLQSPKFNSLVMFIVVVEFILLSAVAPPPFVWTLEVWAFSDYTRYAKGTSFALSPFIEAMVDVNASAIAS